MKTYLLVAIAINCIYHGRAFPDRQDRMFSLFNVVKFRNTPCQATSATALSGTCYTSQECSDKGGTSDGNCAASFGVCCVFRVSTCGTQAIQNCTFIENPGFPTALATANTACSYNVVPSGATDICAIRLDFTQTTLNQPAGATGICGTDTLTVVGGATPQNSVGMIPPLLCGTLTGQHLYLDSARASTAATITVNVPVATTQTWRIKVAHIECNSRFAAPGGCLQWFMGNSGTVTSFNFDGTSTYVTGGNLHNQDYAVCFRQETGMCSIQFAQSTLAAGMASFDLINGATAVSSEATNCIAAYLVIRSDVRASFLSGDRYCGDVLSNVPFDVLYGTSTSYVPANTVVTMSANGGAIRSSFSPFELRVFAGSNAAAVVAPQNMVAGFSVDYQQIPCGTK